jgi:putative flippase GtrA
MISLQYVRGRSLPELLHDFLHAEGARPLRFVVSGAPTAGTQLGLLALLVHSGWPALAANGLAVAITAQLSFVLSHWFTWRGRNVSRSLVCAAGTLVVPLPLASLAGIAAAAIGNFASGDRLIFRHQPGGPAVALAEQIAA